MMLHGKGLGPWYGKMMLEEAVYDMCLNISRGKIDSKVGRALLMLSQSWKSSLPPSPAATLRGTSCQTKQRERVDIRGYNSCSHPNH